jgi:hypothetical protein
MSTTDTIIWRRLDLPGHEWARLTQLDDGWQLDGTAVFVHAAQPCKLDYAIVCDGGWRTSAARITGAAGDRAIDLNILVDESNGWRLNGIHCPEVDGCIDIDLGFSPSTNLLPIRRLGLAVDDEADVRAAWLPFPSLAFEPLPQRYCRESERTYRYESRGGQFVRVLEVNSAGFVVRYPGVWEEETGDV